MILDSKNDLTLHAQMSRHALVSDPVPCPKKSLKTKQAN